MKRETTTFSIRDLRQEFLRIEFPEYQREPTVWTRDQKQRLIDSILRDFDIAPIYLYEREGGGWECIDGRQRLNAIMSFLGENRADSDDNGFSLRINNEVADDGGSDLDHLNDKTFSELEAEQETILDYELITVLLSGSEAPAEFNLQFLRLNLGTLINAGEKLHAMVGVMRDLLFDSDRLGKHPFLDRVGVPTRRYTRELIAAQVMLQVSAKARTNEFTRARHFDLQLYVKEWAEEEAPQVDSVTRTLDALENHGSDLGGKLGNRAICVSVVLAAWELRIRENNTLAAEFTTFIGTFLERLAEQVERMKQYDVDPRYGYLVEFQRNLTQAAVEKPAVTYRHETLTAEFEAWRGGGQLSGDAEVEGSGGA